MKMSNLQKYTIPLGIGEMKREIIQRFIQFQDLLPNSLPKFLFLRVFTGSQPTVLFSSSQTGKLLSTQVTTTDTPSTTCDLLSAPFPSAHRRAAEPLGRLWPLPDSGLSVERCVLLHLCSDLSSCSFSAGVRMPRCSDGSATRRPSPHQMRSLPDCAHAVWMRNKHLFGWPTKVVAK